MLAAIARQRRMLAHAAAASTTPASAATTTATWRRLRRLGSGRDPLIFEFVFVE